MIKEAAPELNASSSEAEEEKEEHPKVDGEKDPDFSQVSPSPYYSSKLKDHFRYTPHIHHTYQFTAASNRNSMWQDNSS